MPGQVSVKKKSTRRRRYRKSKSVAARLRRLERRLMPSEAKFLDVESSLSPTSSGNVAYIGSVAQGDDVSNRDGRSIRPFMYEYNAQITLHASATRSSMRCIVFQDSECIATTPVITTLLVTASTVAMYNLLTSKGRFKIILDKTYNVDTDDPLITDYGKERMSGRILFDGTGATDASAGKGALFVCFISNEATNAPAVVWQHRLHFKDPQ